MSVKSQMPQSSKAMRKIDDLQNENKEMRRLLTHLVRKYVANPHSPSFTFIACITALKRNDELFQVWVEAMKYTQLRKHYYVDQVCYDIGVKFRQGMGFK